MKIQGEKIRWSFDNNCISFSREIKYFSLIIENAEYAYVNEKTVLMLIAGV